MLEHASTVVHIIQIQLLLKLNAKQLIIYYLIYKIQIQLLLKLNWCAMSTVLSKSQNSNTTLVKVKFEGIYMILKTKL